MESMMEWTVDSQQEDTCESYTVNKEIILKVPTIVEPFQVIKDN